MLFAGVLIFIGGILVLGAITVVIFYLLNLQETLKLVSLHNRSIRPGQVWLSLIPLFSIVWNFIMVSRIADSIERELRSRNIPVNGRPGYGVGLTMCILQCIPSLYRVFPNNAQILVFPGGLAFIFMIIYWVQIYNYRKILQTTQSARGNDSLIFPGYNGQ